MSRYLCSSMASLEAYTPGEQPRDMQYIKLNTNESPYPPSEKAIEMIKSELERLRLYPDPTCKTLSAALADTLSVSDNEIIWGNGSDEILFFAFSAFCSHDVGALYPDISYSFYDSSARLCGVDVKKLPLKEDFRLDISEYANSGRTIFIANPNSPTGTALSLEEIEQILKTNRDNVVVVDEAYVDFGAQSAVPLIHKYDNLLVVQTFSKSRSMAGARLGMGIGCAALIEDLNRVKNSLNPYNINRLTLASGIGTLNDAQYTRQCCQKIIMTRGNTEKKLREMGFEFPKSYSNFIFAKHPKLSGEQTYLTLKERGILIRHFNMPRLKDYNRITIGTDEQMDALLNALCRILEETE